MTFFNILFIIIHGVKNLQKLKQTKTLNVHLKTNEFKTHQEIAQTN
jgi:hypothetical protein